MFLIIIAVVTLFQSTPSVWRETQQISHRITYDIGDIKSPSIRRETIHSLRMEGDRIRDIKSPSIRRETDEEYMKEYKEQ